MKPTVGVMPIRRGGDGVGIATEGYLQVLEACGARPLVFPWSAPAALAADLVDRCDGILFTGGHDIEPRRYGEKALGGDYSVERDTLEEFVLMKALAVDMPVFGICRGMQLLNVILGGTLYQDLLMQRPGSIYHPVWTSFEDPAHTVDIVAGSPLNRLLDMDVLPVNSRHHQGIKTVATDVEVMAYATDGLVEAIRHPAKRFLWGVQWHPESMYVAHPEQRLLIQTFVDACSDMMRGES